MVINYKHTLFYGIVLGYGIYILSTNHPWHLVPQEYILRYKMSIHTISNKHLYHTVTTTFIHI